MDWTQGVPHLLEVLCPHTQEDHPCRILEALLTAILRLLGDTKRLPLATTLHPTLIILQNQKNLMLKVRKILRRVLKFVYFI
jgi:hypothetical protein